MATWPEWVWPALAALGILALLWACRGAPLGTAVADDYSFLAWVRFHRPFDLFDSMGAAYYWRPLSRQLYRSMSAVWLLDVPQISAAFNVVFLLGTSIAFYVVMRRTFAPQVAAAIAAFPTLSEPARVLLGWPSMAEHLMAALGALLALNEALAGRRLTAALAALAGVCSHESAALVLPALPLIAWYRTRRMRPALLWGAVAAAVAGIWVLGYVFAVRHAVLLPADPEHGYPWAKLPGVLARAIAAPLNLEDMAPAARRNFGIGYLLLLGAALALLFRRTIRERVIQHAPAIGLAAAWFAAGALPLALLPDWNSWRAWIPGLALGVGFTALLGLASPWLAGGLVALRLTALLLAPAAPTLVDTAAPETTSQMSFQRLARLQRVVESTRRALLAQVPELPRGAHVRYWRIPHLVEFGFQKSAAPRVWYGDSTITLDIFGGDVGMASKPVDAVVEYLPETPWPALVDNIEAFRLFRRGLKQFQSKEFGEVESLMVRAARAQGSTPSPFLSDIYQVRARLAFNLHEFERADSLNQITFQLLRNSPDAWALAARLAMMRGDKREAALALRRCLAIDPTHYERRQLQEILASMD